jgi:hypothetical protein
MTEAEQLKWANEVLNPGELAVFAPTENYPYARIKVGDGKRTLEELDFLIDSAVNTILTQIRFEDSIDGGRITEYTK